MIRKIDNIGVSVKDIRRAKDFYVDKLGLEPVNPYKDGDKELLVRVGESNLYIYQTEKAGTRPAGRTADYLHNELGLDHISFEVDDVDRLYQELGAKGVSFLVSPSENWGMRYIGLNDPDGNVIYLIKWLS